jgi:hypothetical protein
MFQVTFFGYDTNAFFWTRTIFWMLVLLAQLVMIVFIVIHDVCTQITAMSL